MPTQAQTPTRDTNTHTQTQTKRHTVASDCVTVTCAAADAELAIDYRVSLEALCTAMNF